MMIPDQPVTLTELVSFLGGELIGDGSDFVVQGLAALDRAGPNEVSFLTNSKYRHLLAATKAGAVLVSEWSEPSIPCQLIMVPNPYLALARLLAMFNPPVLPETGIHPTANVDSTALVGADVRIDAGVRLEKGAQIGSNTALFSNVYIGKNAVIGADCIVYPNVTICHGVRIGDRVIIQAGAVIGSDGFGFARDGDTYVKIPQIGGVIIEDDVEIGANCTIDRGSMGVTLIHKGSKIDNLVHVAHNVSIGENSAIAAQTGIAGSTSIGNRAIFGGQVGVGGHVKVGDDVICTGRSTVMKNVPPKTMISGFPQMPHREWKRNQVALRHIADFVTAVKDLSTRIVELEKIAGIQNGNEKKEASGDSENSDH